MKKIQFNRVFEHSGVTGHSPSSATAATPKWYKKILKYDNGEKKFDGNGAANLTIKACPPFLDSMTIGYVIYTEFDMHISWEEGEPRFEWRAGGDLISMHGKNQITPEQIPEEYSTQPMKFNNLWQIITPPGYSSMFVHPLNRTDLPFHTLSGIVETDSYKSVVNFPFLIKKDFEGTIPAGTPIVQIIPFKREVWQKEIGDVDQKEFHRNEIKLNHKLVGGYKTQWWRRKEYR